MTNTIQLSLSIHKPDTEIAKDAVAAHDGLKDNPNFVNPPVPLDVFKAAIDDYASKIAAADDGGRQAIIDRNKQRETVWKMMYQPGHWVVANCKDDPGIFQSSGFRAKSRLELRQNRCPNPLSRNWRAGMFRGRFG